MVPEANNFGYGIQVFVTLLFFGMLSISAAGLQSPPGAPRMPHHRCLQTQSTADGTMLKASLPMTIQLLASAPLLVVFVLAASTGLSGSTASTEECAAHTPCCVHTPGDLGLCSTAFRCTKDPSWKVQD